MKFVFDAYDLKKYAITKQQILTTGTSDCKLPKIGRDYIRVQSPGCISREAGYDNASQTDLRDFSKQSQSPSYKAESKKTLQDPIRLSRYVDADHKKYMSAVKQDLHLMQLKNGGLLGSRTRSQCSNGSIEREST